MKSKLGEELNDEVMKTAAEEAKPIIKFEPKPELKLDPKPRGRPKSKENTGGNTGSGSSTDPPKTEPKAEANPKKRKEDTQPRNKKYSKSEFGPTERTAHHSTNKRKEPEPDTENKKTEPEKKAKSEPPPPAHVPAHAIDVNNATTKGHWVNSSLGYLKEQLQLRGVKFNNDEFRIRHYDSKGKPTKNKDNAVKTVPALKKTDLIDKIMDLIKAGKWVK